MKRLWKGWKGGSSADACQRCFINVVETGSFYDSAVQNTAGWIDREQDMDPSDIASQSRLHRIFAERPDVRGNRLEVFAVRSDQLAIVSFRGCLGMGRNPAEGEKEKYKTDS
jgi:hypothetical protein